MSKHFTPKASVTPIRPPGAEKPKPAARKAGDKLNVLVVDDSATVRQVMRALLSQQRGIEVAVAQNPLIAMKKMKKVRPDVILLDLEMPQMDGLTFLEKIMSTDPIPVVICSGHAGKGSENAVRALEQGAVGIVQKPRVGVQEFLHESALMLIDTIRAAAEARVRKKGAVRAIPAAPKLTASAVLTPPRLRAVGITERVVAVGASTGGTDALKQILEQLAPDSPGMVIVQHMPEGFTRAFADRLNAHCRMAVKEAQDGDAVRSGRALIAPGNRHLTVRRKGKKYYAKLLSGPLVSRHRPSIDVLFRSVAKAAGYNALGIILTGMGDDGAAGMLELKQSGAYTVAQNEATCVVFGMPKEAIKRGAADLVLALPAIATTITSSTR